MKITPKFLEFAGPSEPNGVQGALRYEPALDGNDFRRFANSDKGKQVAAQYRAGIGQLREFLVANKAPHRAAAIDALQTFEGRVAEGQGGFYSTRISHVYNDGKSALDTICAEVRNPEIPISTRISVVENLAEGLIVCSEGTVTNLVMAAQDLRMSTGGMRAHAKKAWEEMFDQTVREFCHRKHGHEPVYEGGEIHYVNGYRNLLAKDFGVAERTDVFVATHAVERHVDEARSYVTERVTADALVRYMAEGCLAEVREHLKDYVDRPLDAEEAWQCYQKCDDSLGVSLQCRYGKIDVLVLVSESEGKGTEDAPYTVIDQPTLLMRAIAYNLGDAGVLEKEKFLSLYSEHTDAGPKQIKRITDENFYVKESRDDKVHYRNPYPSDLAFPHAMPLNLLKAALMSTTDPEQLRQIDPGTLWAKMREDESVDLLDNLTHPAVRRYRAADQQNNIALESLALEEVMRDPPERQEQALFKLMGNGEIALSVRIAELLDSAEWHDSNGENVLHRAARLGCNEVLDKLLPRMAEAAPGADGCISFFVNACLMKKPPVAERNKDGETPLMLAALSGDDATVRSLLKHVKRVDEKSNAGMTALMYAASRGHQQVMQLLLDMNANPKAQDRQCRTALHMARDVATARVLIAAGANVNARNEYEETPLMTAVDTDDAALVDLLASMSELNRTDDDGDTALIRAARGKRAALGALLARGADVNYQPSSGWTPLAAAAGVGDVDIVQHLIDKGAEIDKISVDGMTALCLAADCGSVDVVSLLLQKNADRTLVDDEGNSPLLLAAMQGHHEVVAALVAGRRPGTPDGLEAALFFARQRGHEAVVNLLRPVLRNQVRDDSPERGDRE